MRELLARCAYQIAGALCCTFLSHRIFPNNRQQQQHQQQHSICHCVCEGFCLSNICSNAHVFYIHTNHQTTESEKNISQHSYNVTMMMIMTMYDWFNTLFFLFVSFPLHCVYDLSFLLLLTRSVIKCMYSNALRVRERDCRWYTVYKCIAISDKWICASSCSFDTVRHRDEINRNNIRKCTLIFHVWLQHFSKMTERIDKRFMQTPRNGHTPNA